VSQPAEQPSTRPAAVMREIMNVDGTDLTVRPILVSDAEGLNRMFGRLSRKSVYLRFFSPISQLPPAMLARLTNVDHLRRDALVALDGTDIVAVARYDAARPDDTADDETGDDTGTREAEIAVTVVDAWQRRGLGHRLLDRLETLAGRRGYDAFVARILPENRAALELVHKFDPDVDVCFAGGEYEARIPFSARRDRVMDGYLRAARGTRV
jgi:GNAT superfamily N-acetyltransferase